MRRTRLYLPWSLLAGLLALVVTAEGLKATALVLSKLKQAQTSTTTEVPTAEGGEGVEGNMAGELSDKAEDNNSTTPVKQLTGVPQKDYVLDPNLPRELAGYNLTDYPFYERVPEPEEMDFKCDGLHDGFYASVQHKCQVYHHCLFGTRYDFLCANYTAFDQKTFICHFVSEVDCENSPKYFKRNEALYKAATTTTVAPPKPPPPPPPPAAPTRRPQQQAGGRRKRPYSRPRRPVYDYYYDEDYEEDPEYYDDEVAPPTGKGGSRRNRKHPRRPDDLGDDSVAEDTASIDPKSVYDRPRVPPKIRRPVPLNERDKYDYGNNRPTLSPPPTTTSTTTTTEVPSTSSRSKHVDDYYDDEEYVPPVRSRPKNQDYYPPSAGGVDRDIVRRPPMSGAGRPIRRRPGGRRRPVEPVYDDYYDYDFEDELPRRPARPHRKRQRQPERAYTSQRNSGRYDVEEEDEPIPASRPAYITSAAARPGFRKRPAQQADPIDDYRTPQASTSYKRPTVSRKQVPSRYADESDDDYYDDELFEEEPVNRRSRPSPNSRISYQQDEALPAPRTPASTKRPFTSPGRGNGGSSSRSSQTSSKNFPPSAVDIPEDRPSVKSPSQSRQRPDADLPPSQPSRQRYESDPLPPQTSSRQKPDPDAPSAYPSFRQRSEPDLSNPPRPAFRPKSTTTASPPPASLSREVSEKEFPVKSSNGEGEKQSSRNDNRNKEPAAEPGPRIPPSAYGTFRTKPSQGERDPASRNGNSKSRSSANDPEYGGSLSSTIPPSAPSKDAYEEIPPVRPRPVKVIVKPIDRNPPRIPDDIPDRQNLADINEHDFDVTLNDALHPTLLPTRSIEQPPRVFIPKVKSNYVTRAVNYQLQDEPTTASGRGLPYNLQGSASQTYVTRTAFPVHEKYESSTDSSYRARRPSSQYEEERYRDLDEVPRYQQRTSWNRRDQSSGYYTN